ncbi:MAG: multicopper oxidase family protein [Gammaproteobacteria bacterium]|nr:multicopper oxidase family protein [Gammaproteobacteria bacterium]
MNERRTRPRSLSARAATSVRFAALAATLAAAAGCGGPPQSALDVEQPEGWDDELQMREAEDVNPDPSVVEIELEAKITDIELVPGAPTPVWTYNGVLPGPLIRAKVGDSIVVRFKNSLPEATSIHWHGLRLPNDMDGVPGLTQDPIPPGGEFVYEFKARDAGTYWYHPHVNSAAQVGWGLYGSIVVEDPADPEVFGDELVLVLSDMGVDENGQFLPEDTGGEFGDLFGREGNLLLVNGKILPRLKARAGKPQRWRVINAARARYYTLRLPEHTFVKLGGDNGLAERSQELGRVVLVPGERADLVFTPSDEPGTVSVLQWIPTERGFGSVYNRPREDMLEIETVDAAPVVPEPVPEFLREIEPIDITNAEELTLDLTIATETRMHEKEVVMGINDVPYWDSEPLEAAVGQTHVWNITNDTAFAHPFHLHGYFFQVLDDTRIPEWKDTVDVPANSTLRIAVDFDERPGVWMYHCHILDHADSGMMGHLFVAGEGFEKMPKVHLMH